MWIEERTRPAEAGLRPGDPWHRGEDGGKAPERKTFARIRHRGRDVQAAANSNLPSQPGLENDRLGDVQVKTVWWADRMIYEI